MAASELPFTAGRAARGSWKLWRVDCGDRRLLIPATKGGCTESVDCGGSEGGHFSAEVAEIVIVVAWRLTR